MQLQQTAVEETITKAATAAQYAGAGGAVVSGAAPVFGFTPSEWSVIGVIGGLLIALAGYLTTAWFKHQHLKLAIEASRRGKPPPEADE